MIDLHLHTIYSDGLDSVVETLKKAEEIGLEIISITDHDNVDAYIELKGINPKDYFSGNILTGAEFKTFYNGVAVEFLVYCFDIDKVNKLEYIRRRTQDRQAGFLETHKEVGRRIGLKFNEDIQIDEKYRFAAERFIVEVIRHEENNPILEEYGVTNFKEFYRMAQTNPDSIFYIDETGLFPTPEEIVRDIKEAGGLVFLAHPYVYSFEDKVGTAIEIVEKYNLDGIECYYSKETEEDKKKLLKYCVDNFKYISGGSDSHGKAYKPIGCANVPIDIVNDWINLKN